MTDPLNEIDWVRCRAFMERAARHYLGPIRPQEDVEDCAQNALVGLIRYLRKNPAENLEALMNQFARARAMDLLRKTLPREKRTESLDSNPIEHPAEPEDVLNEDMHDRRLFAINEWLVVNAPRCHRIWVQIRSGLNLKDIAEAVASQHATIRQRWKRCKDSLRVAMGDDPDLTF